MRLLLLLLVIVGAPLAWETGGSESESTRDGQSFRSQGRTCRLVPASPADHIRFASLVQRGRGCQPRPFLARINPRQCRSRAKAKVCSNRVPRVLYGKALYAACNVVFCLHTSVRTSTAQLHQHLPIQKPSAAESSSSAQRSTRQKTSEPTSQPKICSESLSPERSCQRALPTISDLRLDQAGQKANECTVALRTHLSQKMHIWCLAALCRPSRWRSTMRPDLKRIHDLTIN